MKIPESMCMMPLHPAFPRAQSGRWRNNAAIKHRGIAQSVRFISAHWRKSIRVHSMAKAAAMSRRGFHKAFAKHTGRTPGRELRRIRLHNAMSLLVYSALKPQVIAKLCGYKRLNSFHVAFKQTTGLSPLQYRVRWAKSKPDTDYKNSTPSLRIHPTGDEFFQERIQRT